MTKEIKQILNENGWEYYGDIDYHNGRIDSVLCFESPLEIEYILNVNAKDTANDLERWSMRFDPFEYAAEYINEESDDIDIEILVHDGETIQDSLETITYELMQAGLI